MMIRAFSRGEKAIDSYLRHPAAVFFASTVDEILPLASEHTERNDLAIILDDRIPNTLEHCHRFTSEKMSIDMSFRKVGN